MYGMKLLIHSQTSTVTVEVWECISNFIVHVLIDVITYSCWDQSQTMLVKGAPGGETGTFRVD